MYRKSTTVSGICFAFAGGFADATGLLLAGTFTGHVTGNTVLAAISLTERHWLDAFRRLLAICIFLISTRAGFLIGRRTVFSVWLLFSIQSLVLLCIALPTLSASRSPHLLLIVGLSMVSGLQNGAVTSAGDVSFHSTFISGDVTKLIEPARHSSTAPTRSDTTGSRTLAALCTGFIAGALCAGALRSHPGLAMLTLLLPLFAAACWSAAALGQKQMDAAA